MIIIFGTRGRITRSSQYDILSKACPSCNSDLELKDMKKWFTLFFIPIFPFDTLDSFYQCTKCGSSYKKTARQALLGSAGNKEDIEKEAKRLLGKTLIACMAHMANIDGEIDPSELEEINKVKTNFSDFSRELDVVYEAIIKSNAPEDYVYSLLRKSSEELTSQAVMSIMAYQPRYYLQMVG